MSLLRALIGVALLTAASPALAQPPSQPQPAQEEFVPLSEVPPGEQIPAFRLVAIAYGMVWVILIGYVWSVSQRLQKVERELAAIERKGP